jgi:hypothetical protein
MPSQWVNLGLRAAAVSDSLGHHADRQLCWTMQFGPPVRNPVVPSPCRGANTSLVPSWNDTGGRPRLARNSPRRMAPEGIEGLFALNADCIGGFAVHGIVTDL